MPTKCDDTILKAVGRSAEDMAASDLAKITQKAKALQDRIQMIRNDPLAMQNVLGNFDKDVQIARLVRKRQTALNYRAQIAQRAKFLNNDFAIKNPAEYAESRFLGSQRDFPGSKDHIMNAEDREQNQRTGAYDAELEKAGIAKLAYSGANDQNTAYATWDLRHGVDEAEVLRQYGKEALTHAKIRIKHQEQMRIDFNREGGWIGQNSDYIARRTYSSEKVATYGGHVYGSHDARTAWVNEMDKRMDWNKAFDGQFADQPAQRRAMLEREFQDFVTGRHDRYEQGQASRDMAGRFAGLASKRSHERKFEFKSKEDEYWVLKSFSKDDSLANTDLSTLSTMGRDIALMKEWGPNPYQNIHKFLSQMADHARDHAPEDVANVEAVRDRFEKRYWPVMTDTTGSAKENAAVHFLSQVRTGIMGAKLGSSVFTNLLDVAPRASMMTYYSRRGTLEFARESLRGVAQFLGVPLHGLSKVLSGKDLYGHTQADIYNVLSEAGIRSAHIFAPLGPGAEDEFGAGVFTKWCQTIFKAGAHFAAHNRVMNNNMVADSFRHWTYRDTPYEKLPVGMQKAMDFYGLGREGWEVLRKQEPMQIAKGMAAFQPSNIRRMDLDNFKSYVGKEDATETQLLRARTEVADKYRNMLGDLADRAATGPRRDVRAIANLGTNNGTLVGELVRGFNMLKGWTYNYMKNHLGRELYGYTPEKIGFAKAITRTLTRPGGAGIGMARMIAAGTLLSAVSINLHEMASGETPSPWTGAEFWEKAFAKQSLGLASDALFSFVNEVNKKEPDVWKAVGSMMGPEIETGTDVLDGGMKAWAHARDKKRKSFQHDIADLTKLGYSNIPGNNLFWLKWATDYFILDNIMETIEPGYKERMQRNAQKRGQSYVMMQQGGQ